MPTLGVPPSWDRGRLARIGSDSLSARRRGSGSSPCLLDPPCPQSRQDAGAPSMRGSGRPPSRSPRSAICLVAPAKGLGHEMDFQFSL